MRKIIQIVLFTFEKRHWICSIIIIEDNHPTPPTPTLISYHISFCSITSIGCVTQINFNDFQAFHRNEEC